MNENSKLSQLLSKRSNSWTKMLNCDPESDENEPNATSRSVKSGHYVYVKPTPLPNPYLVTFSRSLAKTLGLDNESCLSKDFLSVFSGYIKTNSWATPYALSIYGHEMYDNCPFKNDTGYGDGRAVSLMEVMTEDRNGNAIRWELQLKGSGKTPFCRSGDGRAVLRSCVREFIASEAMYHLGVSTTRALCVTASFTEKVYRPWFSGKDKSSKNPDIMQESITAMICRVSTSFVRVGHLELFSRRVKNSQTNKEKQFRMKELELIVEHAIFREYPTVNTLRDSRGNMLPLQERILMMLKMAATRFAELIADWIRIGYVQGNFHSDNCLVGGKVMDYGPFGFLERYDPNWNMWDGSIKEYSFMNQPNAGGKNFETLVDALIPLLDSIHEITANSLKQKYYELSMNYVNKMFALKLGFDKYTPTVNTIKIRLFKLLETNSVDYTIFWRQLAEIVEKFGNYERVDYNKLFMILYDCFYVDDDVNVLNWTEWIEFWFTSLKKLCMIDKINNKTEICIAKSMKSVSPKFIPREWMLVSAYEAANKGNFKIINELQILFETPYAEHSIEIITKYYKKSPLIINGNESIAGVTHMTCSS